MIVSINQPAYLPWLGYFHRIAISDLHIVLDHVQFEKNSFTNRNRVRVGADAAWLTVPVRTKGRFGDLPIRSLEIADARFATKHWATISQSYARAPHFASLAGPLEAIFKRDWNLLAPLLDAVAEPQFAALGITTPLVSSSELAARGTKSDLILDLCREVGATTYLSGPFGRDYLDLSSFSDAGIEVRFHEYRHPRYPQVHGGFVPYMAALDLIVNCGPDSARVLSEGQEAMP